MLPEIRARLRPVVESRNDVDWYYNDVLVPALANGLGLTTTYAGMRVTEIVNTLPAYMAALRGCPPAFAAQMVRSLVLSQARFTFRKRGGSARAAKTFGTRALAPLERPWPNATTGQMLGLMEWHAGVAGNAYVHRQPKRLRVLRPDWTVIVYGSEQEPEDAAMALDGELLGYAYANGGIIAPGSGTISGIANRVWTMLPDEVAHYTASGLPDPEGGGIGMSWLTPLLRDLQGDKAASEHKVMFWRNGAPQPLSAKVLTPAGWSTMGETAVGSRVIGSDGKGHTVTAVYPQGERDIYRIDFIDGGSAECTLDHVWTVSNLYDRKRGVTRNMTLAELLDDGLHYASGPAKWAVPLVDPVEYDTAPDLPLDPYLLGYLLGNGCMRTNGHGSGGVSLVSAAWDADEIEQTITPMLPAGVVITRRDRRATGEGNYSEFYFRRAEPRITARGEHGHIKGHASNSLTDIIKGLGLWDVVARTKFVPEPYLRASVKDRIAILQGLLDSDGHVEPTALIFTTTSHHLARAVVELVQSLGGTSRIRPNKGRDTLTVTIRQLPDWIVPLRLTRKADKYRVLAKPRIRTIVGAELVRREQAQCIAVASADHLYVTDNYVLTHNSPNLVVSGIPAATKAQFEEIVDQLESQHTGIKNAFRTLYLTVGADAKVIGSNFRDMDLKAVQGAIETRIAFTSRVPASLLGISEGLAGSSLNSGNFDAARRVFADTWVSPTLQDYAASLAPLVDVPSDAELWPDTVDMPILRDDSKAAAEIEQLKQASIVAYVNAGFDPASAVLAVAQQDVSQLRHTGLLSVQVQPPGSPAPGSESTDQGAPDSEAT